MLPLNYFLFLQIILFLFITPGPPRIVIVSYSMNYGVQKCIWTALGDISANILQATLVIFVIGSFFSENPTFSKKCGESDFLAPFWAPNSVKIREKSVSRTTHFFDCFLVAFFYNSGLQSAPRRDPQMGVQFRVYAVLGLSGGALGHFWGRCLLFH